MKLNYMVCPTCGHDFYTDAAYATCDACQTMFYAASSRTVTDRPQCVLPSTTNVIRYWTARTP